MIPFKCSFKLSREIIKLPLLLSLAYAILDEIGWRTTKKRWKKQMPFWGKIREHGAKAGVKGKISKAKIG